MIPTDRILLLGALFPVLPGAPAAAQSGTGGVSGLVLPDTLGKVYILLNPERG